MEQEQRRPTPPPRFGLDTATIVRLPSFPYLQAHDNGEVSDTAASVECAVCLSAVDEGEKVKQLPACGHVFHQDDIWLSSHASCPVCHGKAAPADELADAIAARISVTRDVVVPASSPPPSSPAVRSARSPSPLRCSAAALRKITATRATDISCDPVFDYACPSWPNRSASSESNFPGCPATVTRTVKKRESSVSNPRLLSDSDNQTHGP
uniref:RING-type E3 ubiquitin transferase n=1 Tax=Oryza meridionalis TaxID=40149 RepID=A0A0E0CVP6_9ORYZ